MGRKQLGTWQPAGQSRKQREVDACTQAAFSLLFCPGPHGLVLPTFRVGLSFSVHPSGKVSEDTLGDKSSQVDTVYSPPCMI